MTSFRLLVIDDEPDFVDILLKRLRKKAVHCLGALSGREGMAQLRSQEFDVVLLDMRLPDLDGNALLRLIKQEYPAVEVVMLTGQASLQAGREGMRDGAFDYLLKPLELESLHEKLLAAYRQKMALVT